MSRWLFLFIMGAGWLLHSFPLAAQTYHVYRPVSATHIEKPSSDSFLLEIQAASLLSLGTIEDSEGHSISRYMYGLRGRMLVRLTDWLSVGAEGEHLKSHDIQTERLDPFERKAWGGLVKITLTPDTTAQFYVLAGVGQTKQRTQLRLRPHAFTQSSMVLMGGLGVEWPVWQGLALSGEYVLHYDRERWHNFILKSPRVRQELALGISYRF